MTEIPELTCCISSSQSINTSWQSSVQTLQTTIPYQYLYYKEISNNFKKDNSNMLKDTLVNNSISNSPPKIMDSQKISISNYQILDTIGKGACGFVKLAKRKEDGKKVIIKYVVKSLVLDGCWVRENDKMVPYEIHILQYITENFPHPYILRLLNTWEDHYYYYLEFESENVMDLFECIENRHFTTEAEVKRIFYQIAQAVQHLHHINIVHRDIKDENILIRLDTDTVELIDFGSSAYVTEGKKFDKFCGTGGYAAPEVLKGQKYDGPPQDIWSLGILLYTMIYGNNPFRTLDQIITSEVQFPVIVSPGSHDLMCTMLNRDHTKRPTIDKVLAHPWFDDMDPKDKVVPKLENIYKEAAEAKIPLSQNLNTTSFTNLKNNIKKDENENENETKTETKTEIEIETEQQVNESSTYCCNSPSYLSNTPNSSNESIGQSSNNSSTNSTKAMATTSYINEILCKKLETQSISNEEGNLSDSTLVDI